MPSKSAKQHRTMCAIAHGAKLDKVDVPMKVAKEFCDADKRKKHGLAPKKR